MFDHSWPKVHGKHVIWLRTFVDLGGWEVQQNSAILGLPALGHPVELSAQSFDTPLRDSIELKEWRGRISGNGPLSEFDVNL